MNVLRERDANAAPEGALEGEEEAWNDGTRRHCGRTAGGEAVERAGGRQVKAEAEIDVVRRRGKQNRSLGSGNDLSELQQLEPRPLGNCVRWFFSCQPTGHGRRTCGHAGRSLWFSLECREWTPVMVGDGFSSLPQGRGRNGTSGRAGVAASLRHAAALLPACCTDRLMLVDPISHPGTTTPPTDQPQASPAMTRLLPERRPGCSCVCVILGR